MTSGEIVVHGNADDGVGFGTYNGTIVVHGVMEAAEVSRKYLDHVTTSLDFRRHKPRKRIITDLR